MNIHDVRRILAIGQAEGFDGHQGPGQFYLSYYGHGKVCIEIADCSGSRAATRRPTNEEVLNTVFSNNLKQRWKLYKSDNPTGPSPSNFLASFPLSPITPCTSVAKVAPLLSKRSKTPWRPQSRRHQSPAKTIIHHICKPYRSPTSAKNKGNLHSPLHRPFRPTQSQATPPVHPPLGSLRGISGTEIRNPTRAGDCACVGESRLFFIDKETCQRR